MSETTFNDALGSLRTVRRWNRFLSSRRLISLEQAELLRMIRDIGYRRHYGARPGELEKATNISTTAVKASAEHLRRFGLIERRDGPRVKRDEFNHAQRAIYYKVTPTGLSLLKELESLVDTGEDDDE